jgi:hypothetical protein
MVTVCLQDAGLDDALWRGGGQEAREGAIACAYGGLAPRKYDWFWGGAKGERALKARERATSITCQASNENGQLANLHVLFLHRISVRH